MTITIKQSIAVVALGLLLFGAYKFVVYGIAQQKLAVDKANEANQKSQAMIDAVNSGLILQVLSNQVTQLRLQSRLQEQQLKNGN